jgi:hypothetical protein
MRFFTLRPLGTFNASAYSPLRLGSILNPFCCVDWLTGNIDAWIGSTHSNYRPFPIAYFRDSFANGLLEDGLDCANVACDDRDLRTKFGEDLLFHSCMILISDQDTERASTKVPCTKA